MISSGDGYRLVSQHRAGFPSNPSVWSYGMAVPWQHPSQQLAFPVPLHFVTPQLNTQWFPLDNFASLPPKPKINQGNQSTLVNTKPSRRFSDPGPRVRVCDVSDKPNLSYKKKVANEDKCNLSENQHIADEANKDRIFSNLLQELRTAHDFNRQLCLELHKANMKLHLTQQHANEHQPGSMAALVRKLYEAHHIRSEVLSNWSKSGESFGRKGSCTSNKFDSDDPEEALLKEREVLITKLQSTEKKIQRVRNAQWNGTVTESPYPCCQHNTDQRSPMNTSRCMGDVLSFNKVSRNHSFAMTSPSTSDPPSLEDLDIASSKHYGGIGSTNSGLSHLLLQPSRPLLEGRTCVPNSNVLIQGATSVVCPTLKRDIELQLATVERDRRQLEHQLQDSIGTRRLSEDRVIKLERLVSVLRKKLDMQTTIHNASSSNCSAALPSPTENKKPTNTNYSTTPNDYAANLASGRTSQTSMEGPASLPSYLQVVGPVTQL